jgi:hypothetical protein
MDEHQNQSNLESPYVHVRKQPTVEPFIQSRTYVRMWMRVDIRMRSVGDTCRLFRPQMA